VGEQIPTFTKFSDSTRADWDLIVEKSRRVQRAVPEQILEGLHKLGDELDGYPVTRLHHSLQTATRAERDGRDLAYVMCALVHDIGDSLAPDNPEAIGAAIVKPFVGDDLHWMLAHHGIFQGYYFWEYIGLDSNARDAFIGHPYYDLTAEFCALYDQVSFDPQYDTHTLEHFEPLVRSFFSEPRHH
jgi:predicted HD phosphohydrolase